MENAVAQFHDEAKKSNADMDVLRNMDLFVLDNSIRETTVAQVRGHTIDAKWAIYKEVKKMGFNDYIVATFSHSVSRVDDMFLQQLQASGENMDRMWAFSEIFEGDWDTIPAGIDKIQAYGLKNVIFELDLVNTPSSIGEINVQQIFEQVKKWILWCQERLGCGGNKGRTFINFRDPTDTMPSHPERAYELITLLGSMDPSIRPIGVVFEEATGNSRPEEVGRWSRFMRDAMKSVNWDGHLLIHVHEKFGLADQVAIEALKNGCNGIWAGVCADGASIGHASSCNTIMNLIRYGNTKVLDKFNCKYLRQAAINVSKTTTGVLPHSMTPIYGARAADFVFSMTGGGMGGGAGGSTMDMSDFFEIPKVIRMSSLASLNMIRQKLLDFFGENDSFTLDMAKAMKDVLLDDLKENRKEEYNSKAGLAVLFDRAGGKLTESMTDAVHQVELKSSYAKSLIAEIRGRWDMWDLWDLLEGGCGDDMLPYDSFYNGFMAPYFSCYRCLDTRKALSAIDMDNDGKVDWKEFSLYLRWAFRQYPDVANADELLSNAFVLGIMPAMQDELLRRAKGC